MTFFTRNRGSKYLRARGGGGRFKRATIADFGMAVCSACNRFFEAKVMPEDDPFPMPVRVKNCPHCGAAVPPPKPEL